MFSKRFNELADIVKNAVYTAQNEEIDETKALHLSISLLQEVKNKNKKVYVIGNGGSVGIASHFCVDLINVLKIPALTLYDTNVMSCISNDYGYNQVFSRPLQTLLQEDDLLIAISSSGKSPSILQAVDVAHQKKAHLMTLSGFSSHNPLREKGKLNIWLDSLDYGLVESGHFFLLHTIIDLGKQKTRIEQLVYAR